MPPTTVSFHEESEADLMKAALEASGFYVESAKERFLGEDDDEEVVYLLLTDAHPDDARRLVVGDGFVVG